ncbi:hypothetical protein AMTRI_Chr10g230440 [Amborella trichopoda]
MFSPASKKPNLGLQNQRSSGHGGASGSRTPLPRSPRLSVLARLPLDSKSEKGANLDQIQPVYIGEFPQLVRNAQANLHQKGPPGISGGMDKGTCLSWILCGNQLFIWSHVSGVASQRCVALELPSFVYVDEDHGANSRPGDGWILCAIEWDRTSKSSEKLARECSSIGIIICNQKTRALLYWPNIYSENGRSSVSWFPSHDESEEMTPSREGKVNPSRRPNQRWIGTSGSKDPSPVNSLIVSPVPGSTCNECIALLCQSNGELWCFRCSPSGISREKVVQVFGAPFSRESDCGAPVMNKRYSRSLTWRHQVVSGDESNRQFFLLTDHEIQCWSVDLGPERKVLKWWSHEIVGSDNDLGIKKDLAGQKHVWLLDLQVSDNGKELTVLVATFCKDRVSSSSYTQYSLLTMQYKSSENISKEHGGSSNVRVLEKKAPIQVILPKARVEEEDFLFSMRLRIGGRPSGSTMVLSGDGIATVAQYWRGATRLYQFDLPWDAGKVIDASVLPAMDDGEEGAWVVLTEKAGVWAIPEKAVLLGGVEPPERSLSRKGSSNEGSSEEEKRSMAFGGNIAPRRVSSEAWDAGDRQRPVSISISQRNAQDEEAEALVGRLFHAFLYSGQVDGVLEKLKVSGAFDKDGEKNIFARASKSIVDALAKHWTTTRGAEIVAMAVVSSQLLEKQQRHQRFLHFLALTKCHEGLSFRQRGSLHAIMEHGEKLAALIQLRELQSAVSQSKSSEGDSLNNSSSSEISGSLWELIQLVGEKARRNNVLLMDRENAEVFYSRVSDLEEFFSCISQHLPYIVGGKSIVTQIHRTCEIANACAAIIRAAITYKNAQQSWYPSSEGITPWYCQGLVRSGLWSLASLILQLLKEAEGLDSSMKSELFSHLEELADCLLEAYAVSIAAKIEREEEYKGLQAEYWTRRDVLLDFMYQQIKDVVASRCQGIESGSKISEQKDAILKELVGPLVTISRRHAGYKTLWTICCDLNDMEFLRSLMYESMGLKQGRFSNYVFEQCYKNHHYAKLLRLGEEFQEDLSSFLLRHRDLLWLHEIFLGRFSSAAESLHSLALSQDDDSAAATEEYSDIEKRDQSLTDRRRLLDLSKIAAAAGREPGFEMKIKRIEADLHILKLQEEVQGLCDFEKRLLNPKELIEICLKSGNRELILRAFDVFAWTSSPVRKTHKTLLSECWMSAASQDDWATTYKAAIAEGWSDEENLQLVKNTVLFQASKRCYGLEAQSYDGGFEEVLPLLKEDVDFMKMKEPGSSVEAIIMQHPDFPEAGKLMLMAVVMGKFGGGENEEDLAMQEE